MKKYISLLNINKLKEHFIVDLISIFSTLNSHEEIVAAIELDNSASFNQYLRLLTWVKDKALPSEKEKLEEFKEKYKTVSINRWENFGITEIQYYLIDKVRHIILNKGDFKSAYMMLESFHRGTKRLKSNIRGNEDYYFWSVRGGTEYSRHEKNLPRAHFRWNYGERYTLDWESIVKIDKFLNDNVL